MPEIATIYFRGTIDSITLHQAVRNGGLEKIKQLSSLATIKLQKQYLEHLSHVEPLSFRLTDTEGRYITCYISEVGDVFVFPYERKRTAHFELMTYLNSLDSSEDSVVKPTYPCLEIL